MASPPSSSTPPLPEAAGGAGDKAATKRIGLDPSLLAIIDWPCYRIDVPPEQVRANELYKLWTTFPGGHKWTHYFSIYEAVFGPLRALPLRILEIGVWRGASLALWRKYFEHPQTTLVGIDILPECAKFDRPAEGIHVRIGSQTDSEFLKQVVREFGPFDLIIDDGSHHSADMITSFNCLYSDGLKDSGIYFAEDLHANYWRPWRDSQKSFLDLCKDLMECMHAHYYYRPPRGGFFIDKASDQSEASLPVPRITRMLREIRVFDSMVAIYKANLPHVPYYLRLDD
jgi:hypothetical protein